ncbi:esterase [Phormidium sp. LEGE 05292]|uniref:YqiA/YcfP family alpha/beta fold hydrolase n=1 Tax=[Phormidium] sp. LEGE 05292 TaxID=767427 RepID=UPI001881D7E0|nr:YqiA/YcfP family alpha/beta fold hydrolase [Phormidium sp. LEGE 05292]MBE9229953.1 esterase [Phormidium sp. LEGE 05292]
MNSEYIYLHGFASSPNSVKANFLRDRFSQSQIPLTIPDLNQSDFTHLTMTRQLRQVIVNFPPSPTPVTLIGSSFGGLASAWLGETELQCQKLVLLAPAFTFLSLWLSTLGEKIVASWQREGFFPVHHYGEKRSLPLSYDFVTDLKQYPETKIQRPIPTLIIHGIKDEVIPIQASRDFAASRPWIKLIELDSDHSLANVLPEIWQEISTFCQLSNF